MKQFKLRWIIIALIVILIATCFYFANSVPNSTNIETAHQVNKIDEIANDNQLDKSSSNFSTVTNPQVSPSKDPFKEFLDKKGKSQPSATADTKPTYPPGFDPFKAKLEEQKNEPHSAVSPFSK